MNKILSFIKKYSAMGVALLCACSVPFAAACNATGDPNAGDGADKTEVTAPAGDGSYSDGQNNGGAMGAPDNPTLPTPDTGDISGSEPVDEPYPDDNGGNTTGDNGHLDFDANGEPIVPEPEETDNVENPFAGEVSSSPNGQTKYENADNWALMELGGRYQDKKADGTYTGVWKTNAWTNDMLEEGWREAIIQSVETTQTVTIKLNCDWTAEEDFFLGTSFGSGSGFGDYSTYAYGPLKIPVGASIILDLNGYKLDRALSHSTTVSPLGMVIMVNGKLLIKDSNPNKTTTINNPTEFVDTRVSGDTQVGTLNIKGGAITGGMNLYGAGVYVGQLSDAICVLESGSIAGNIATNSGSTGANTSGRGGGVYMTNNASFLMTGGYVSYNTACLGGGIWLPANGNLTIEGGTILHNVATTKTSSNASGGGVFLEKDFTVSAGTYSENFAITGNRIVDGTATGSAYSYGGAIYSSRNLYITDGLIEKNVASVGGAAKASGNLYMSGGTLSENYVMWVHNWEATFGSTMQCDGILYLSGGEIVRNSMRDPNGTRIDAFRGLIHSSAGRLIMTGGKVNDNTCAANYGVVGYSPSVYCYVLGGEICGNTGSSCIFFGVAYGGATVSCTLRNVLIANNNVSFIIYTFVYAGSPNIFEIGDGTKIINNTLASAVYGSLDTADFTFGDCIIANNIVSSYAVYSNLGKLRINGTPQIYGNKGSATATDEKNMYVINGNNQTVQILSPLKENGKQAHVGLTLSSYNTSSYPITSGYSTYVKTSSGNVDAETYNYFYMDSASYQSTKLMSGEVYYNNANKPSNTNIWRVKDGSNAWTDTTTGASSYTKVYDGKPLQVALGSGSTTAKGIASSTNGTAANTTSLVNAGTYIFTNGAGNSYKNPTFTVTITPLTLHVDGNPTITTQKVYDGNDSCAATIGNMTFTQPSDGAKLTLKVRANYKTSAVGNGIVVYVFPYFVNEKGEENTNYVPDMAMIPMSANIVAQSSGTGGEPLPHILQRIEAAYTNTVTIAINTPNRDANIRSQIKCTGYYSDGTSANITDFTLDKAIAVGTNTLTVSYGGFTSNSITFTIYNTVVGLTIVNNQPDRTYYYRSLVSDSYSYISKYYAYSTGARSVGLNTFMSYTISNYTGTDIFGQPSGTLTLSYTYYGFSGSCTVNITPATMSTVTATFRQPSSPIFITTPINDLKQYISVSYVRNDSLTGTLGASEYTIVGSLTNTTSSGGKRYAQLSVRSTKTGVESAKFNVEVQEKEIIAIKARVTQKENQIIYAGYPLTVLPNFVEVKTIYNTDLTAANMGMSYDDYTKLSQSAKNDLYEKIFTQRWSNLTTITDYTLRGSLVVGNPYITVTYGGKTAEFQVSVSPVTFTQFAASFTQGNLRILDTMSLDVLKPNLTVHTLSTNGIAGTTKDYNLSYAGYFDSNGILKEGTTPDDPARTFQRNAVNLIRVTYVNDSQVTSTFRVSVTNIYLQRLDAEWSQPTTDIYVGANIDTLKSNLKVTAIMVGEANRVLGANEYTLTGNLTAGQPIVTVTYSGIITTFRPTITAVLVKTITATYDQGTSAVYTSTPETTIKSFLTVTATYNNGTTKVLDGNMYLLNYTLVAGAGISTTTTPKCDIKVTYRGIDFVGDTAPYIELKEKIVVQDAVLVKLVAKLDKKVWNVAANTIFETTTDAETKAQLARIPTMLLSDGTQALKVTPYYSKNGKLSGMYPGDTFTIAQQGEYTLAIDPKMGTELLKAGANEIVVSHGGFTASITITVTKVALTGITATGNFPKDDNGNSLIYGTTSLETIKSYISVTATYNNNTSRGVTNFRLEAPKGEVSDTNNRFTVYYSEDGVDKSYKIDVPVAPRVLLRITADYVSGATDTVYTDTKLSDIGSTSYRGKLTVKAYYNDSASGRDVLSSDYVISGELAAGLCTLTVNYNGKTATFDVEVVEAEIISISISSFNSNQKIYASTPLNSLKDLLEVRGTTNSGVTSTLAKSEYTVTGNLKTVRDDYGTVISEPYITLIYNKNNAVTVTRPVAVEQAVLSRIEVIFNQSTANNGSEYTIFASTDPADLQAIKGRITRVTAYYSDGVEERSEAIDSYTLTGSIATAGTSTLTVSYNGKSATFNVRVTALTITGITANFEQTSRVFTATPLETIKTMLTVRPRYNNGELGAALSTNEYKIERRGAYEEKYTITKVTNNEEVKTSINATTLNYSKIYYKVYDGDESYLTSKDCEYPDYVTYETVNSVGETIKTYYVPISRSEANGTMPEAYRIDRYYTITSTSFQPGLLGLFEVTLNVNTALKAEFTANIDTAKLVSISAEWSKTGDIVGPTRNVYTSTALDDLREWLTVYAYYEDDDLEGEDDDKKNIGGTIVKERIIGDYTLSTVTGGLTAGQCSVAVGYNGLIDSIVVSNVQPIQVMTATAVYNQKGKVYESTPLDDLKSMLTITAYNNDGSSKTVTSDGYTLEVVAVDGKSATSFKAGSSSTVEVTLKEHTSVTTTFAIDVESFKIINISATEITRPTGVTIYTSTALESIKRYIEVTANFEDGSGSTKSEKVVDFQLTGTLTAGESVLLITYNGKITSCILHNVVAVQATAITATIDQTAKVYSTTELEKLKSMITVDATYNNGTSGVVSAEEYALTGELTAGETCAVTVSYTGATSYTVASVQVEIDVESVVLTRISYENHQGDNDIVYVTDDIYKLSQYLNVYAHYSDGGVELEKQEVGGYTLTGELTAGYIPILITYNGLSTFFNAQITAVSLQGISVSYRPTTEVYAATPVDSLKEMIYVEAYYNNGKTEELSGSDYYLSVSTTVKDDKTNAEHTYGYFIAGQVSTVTVTYGRDVNMKDTFSVSVESSQLSHITAEYDSANAKIYYGKSTVEDLRRYLSVTAHYEEPVYEESKDENGKVVYNKVIKDKPVVVTGYTLSGVLEKDRSNRISVFYSGAVDYFTVTPENVTLQNISVSFRQTERLYESTPVTYLKGMLEVTALYSDGTGVSVAGSEYEVSALDGTAIAANRDKFVLTPIIVGSSVVGYTSGVRVTYTEGGVTITSDTTVQIERYVIIGVEAEFEQGDRVFYAINDVAELRPLITATVQIGPEGGPAHHSEVVTDYFLLTENDNLFVEGTNRITLNYNGKETSFEVYVTPKASVGLVAEFTQVTKVFKTTPLFDLKDMLVVRKQYNDGTYETVTNYSLAVLTDGTQTSNVLHVGTNYVNVYYNDNGTQITTTFEVSVEATSLSYITVDYTQGGNKVYTSQSLSFLVQWLKVWAHYNDSSVIEIITGYNLVGELYAGTSVITVTYGGKQTTFNATVTDVALVSMSARLTQTAKVYESTSLDSLKSMLTVNLIYNNGETKEVPEADYYVSGALVAGENCQMTVVYLKDQSQVAYFYVHVVATVLDRIEARITGTLPTIYTTTDINLIKDYLTVTAYYAVSDVDSSSTETEEVYDYTLTTETGKLTAGNERITVNYNGFTYPITVKVEQTVATKLNVRFEQGDVKIYDSTPLDVLRELLTVDVEFNDGKTSYDIKDYAIERVGTQTVSISYGEAPAYEVTYTRETRRISVLEVVPLTSGEIVLSTSVELGSIKDYLRVTAVFNNGDREQISAADYTLEGTIAEGTCQLTVRYNGKNARVNVTFEAPHVIGIRLAEEFVQGYNKIYSSTPLENLKKLITVIATYSDGTESELKEYNITGTLVKGQSCRVVVSVGEYREEFYVQVEDVAVSHIDANPTLPVMTVQMYNTSETQNLHVGDTLEWIKQYLVVCVYPTGLSNATGDQSKYKLTSTQYTLTGDTNTATTINGQLYLTLTVTYTNTYTLTATIQVPVKPRA